MVAVGSCGGECRSVYVIDVRTGAVYPFRHALVVYQLYGAMENPPPEVEYRLNSRLIIFRGNRDEKEKDFGTHYYVFRRNRFIHLRSVPWHRKASAIRKGRFTLTLRDRRGRRYRVYLFARDEKTRIVGNKDFFSGADVGDRMVEGTYRLALCRRGWTKPKVQPVWPLADGPAYGEFNLNRRMVYVLRHRTSAQPDVLVVEQHAGSNGNDGRIFYVKDGRLVPVVFLVPHEKPTHEFFWSRGTLKSASAFRFTSSDYNNTTSAYDRSSWRTWLFRPWQAQFLQIAIRH